MTPPKVFICYARTDNESGDPHQRWLDRVRRHLKPFERQGDFEVFADDCVELADDWHDRIQGELSTARVVILLISSAFLASDYVSGSELPVLLERSRNNGVKIIPVIISHCAYETVTFRYPDPKSGPKKKKLSSLQSAGSTQKSLAEAPYGEQERILTDMAEAVAKLAAKPPDVLPPVPPESERQEFTNSLGMRFVPVPGIKAWFSIWQTRVCDYAEYAKANPKIDGSWKEPVFEGVPVTPGPLHPVVNVSWQDAVAFCQWLTQKEQSEGKLKPGESYRLPTDLEWSAAVGLTGESGRTPKDRDQKIQEVYPWGKQWPPVDAQGKPLGNFRDESFKARFPGKTFISGYEDGFPTTSPVGRFPPLANGLFDMAGNVWEWCGDLYEPSETARVLRGGSWRVSVPEHLLSSCRLNFEPVGRNDSVGFRCVVELGGAAR